jgi:hypothetical protein
MSGVILELKFEKTYDKVNWEFLQQTYYFLRDTDFILYDDLLDKNMSNVPKGKKIKLPSELYAG